MTAPPVSPVYIALTSSFRYSNISIFTGCHQYPCKMQNNIGESPITSSVKHQSKWIFQSVVSILLIQASFNGVWESILVRLAVPLVRRGVSTMMKLKLEKPTKRCRYSQWTPGSDVERVNGVIPTDSEEDIFITLRGTGATRAAVSGTSLRVLKSRIAFARPGRNQGQSYERWWQMRWVHTLKIEEGICEDHSTERDSATAELNETGDRDWDKKQHIGDLKGG